MLLFFFLHILSPPNIIFIGFWLASDSCLSLEQYELNSNIDLTSYSTASSDDISQNSQSDAAVFQIKILLCNIALRSSTTDVDLVPILLALIILQIYVSELCRVLEIGQRKTKTKHRRLHSLRVFAWASGMSSNPVSPYIHPFMTNSFIYFRFLLKGHFLNEKLLNNHICLHRSKAPSSWTDSLTSLQFSLRCCAVCVHWMGFRPLSNPLLVFPFMSICWKEWKISQWNINSHYKTSYPYRAQLPMNITLSQSELLLQYE